MKKPTKSPFLSVRMIAGTSTLGSRYFVLAAEVLFLLLDVVDVVLSIVATAV